MRPRAPNVALPLLTGGVFVLALPLFLRIAFHSGSDIGYHADFIRQLVRAFFVPIDFVYYYGVAVLSLFSPVRERILVASAVLLSAALAAKYHVTVGCAARHAGARSVGQGIPPSIWLPCLGLLFVVCLPLPGHHWYLGQFPPNQWHNSTTMMLMPFAVLLFFSSADYLEHGETGQLRAVLLWTLANGVTKPSLLFVFGPVFPLAALLRFGWSRRFLQACLPAAAVALIVLVYYVVGFGNTTYTTIQAEEASVALGWFFPWRVFSPSIPLSVLDSLLLPLVFLASYPRECLRDLRLRYAAAMLVLGLAIFSFFHETGDRALHGNLLWQNIIVNYLLHLSVLLAFLRIKRGAPRWTGRDRLLAGAFLLEVALGLAYLGRLLIHGTYV